MSSSAMRGKQSLGSPSSTPANDSRRQHSCTTGTEIEGSAELAVEGNRSRSLYLIYDVQPADQSTAKDWVKNPGGAICRNDRMGVSLVSPPASRLTSVTPLASRLSPPTSTTVPPSNSPRANASGLESQPPGSAGRLSRPATVK